MMNVDGKSLPILVRKRLDGMYVGMHVFLKNWGAVSVTVILIPVLDNFGLGLHTFRIGYLIIKK